MEILKEADLFDKTLILFTSDHGMAFSGGKTTVYEPGLRVPFVVRDPYSKGRGVRTQSIVNHTDQVVFLGQSSHCFNVADFEKWIG